MTTAADILRLLGDLAREGRVVSVDPAAGTARVALGNLVTGDIPWTSPRAGRIRVWCPPAVGEQVLVTAHEDCCLAIADVLTGFVAEGCAILVLPWRKGLYRCGISLPADARADLASDIAAQAQRAGDAWQDAQAPLASS